MAKTDAQRQKARKDRLDAQGLIKLSGPIVRKKDAEKARELVRKTFPVD